MFPGVSETSLSAANRSPLNAAGFFLCIAILAVPAHFPAQAALPEQAGREHAARANDAARPNIIFLLTDDQRADTLSIAGNRHIRTPNIDRLARGGVRYSNAFTVEPICAASRFAFLSGQYERVSGLGFNSPYQVSDRQWRSTYPALLREEGYYTGFIGKFGVEFYSLEGGAPSQFDYWRAHDGWLPFFPGDLPDNPATAIYRDAKHTITTEIMGEYIADFLATRPAEQPFQLSVSFSAPHNSVVSSMYTAGADPDCDSYACRVMGYPANGNPRLRGHPFYDTLYRDSPPDIAEHTGKSPFAFIPEGVIDHQARQQWYAYNYDRQLQPEHLIRYYQTISGVDAVIGDLLRQLEEQGLADNTVIIYSSDHGLLNGEYGTGGKALLYDLVARIPLIVHDPRRGHTAAPEVSEDLVLSIDVPATLLSLAGVAIPEAMQGRALGDGKLPRQEIFLESLTVAEGNPFMEALRSREWKYIRYFARTGCPYGEEQLDLNAADPVFEQLFHIASDPGERVNLAGMKKHRAVLQAFRARAKQRSADLTAQGRRYKLSLPVQLRPGDREYCW
jgi:arylsulfatase A-like enzyme